MSTILNDAPVTDRKSYVGINSIDSNQSQIFNQINNRMVTSKETVNRIKVEEIKIPSGQAFEAEEIVSNLFQNPQGPADIIVCMDEVDTEAVYQAVIDYNSVGKTQIKQMVERMNSVYISNVNLNELSEVLSDVQNFMYKYLQVKDSESLTNYYRAEQDYRKLLEGLNVTVTDNQIQILEKNIRNMLDSYLAVTDETVQAKRGQNVEKYKSSYESALKLYRFINRDISVLNSRQFKNNSASYQTLQAALQYLEVISTVILMIVMVIGLLDIYHNKIVVMPLFLVILQKD
ncbi:hypothetical protein ABFV83_19230 [Lacrimispora sp. BS-2]|uniref:Uncharacterized protein n=1 Tax=Lacrimispora sp. BS-2 TaxID=3151850 RepID=A0AAU7PNS7_9FIRM